LAFLSRANELFSVSVRAGRLSITRGRLPQRLLDDMGDVVRAVPRATVRAVSEGGRPRLIVRGAIDAMQAQRLRNLLGEWTVAQLRSAPKPRRGARS
jgi:hypothetical protein